MMNNRNFKNKNRNKNKYNTTNIDNRTPNKPWLITVLAAMVLILAVVVIMALLSAPGTQNTDNGNTATPDSAGVTLPTTPDETIDQNISSSLNEEEAQTQSSDYVSDTEQPQELTDLLLTVGNSYSSLRDYNCSQLVTVDSSGTEAEIKLWECTNGRWTVSESHTCYGYVGSMGTVDNMSEYISGTPRGIYGIAEAFYRNNMPQTNLQAFQITDDTYWVDDPDSDYYNQRVVGTDYKDWNSAEPMAQYSAYNYGFVVEYNMYPVVPGAGSAIFFHIGSSPTAGCIATSEDMVLSYLSSLDKNLSPHILIN